MKNNISGSANATAVFRLRSRSFSVTTAMRTSSSRACRFLRRRKSFPKPNREKDLCIPRGFGRAVRLAARVRWIRDGVHENLVADRTARDVQALHQRHARADQRAEHPAKARHRKLRDQRPDERRFSKSSLPRCAGLFPKQTRCAPEIR